MRRTLKAIHRSVEHRYSKANPHISPASRTYALQCGRAVQSKKRKKLAMFRAIAMTLLAFVLLLAGCAQQPLGPIYVDKSIHVTVPIEQLTATGMSRIEITTPTTTNNTADLDAAASLDNSPTTDVRPNIALPLP